MNPSNKRIVIVGGGASGLMAGLFLNPSFEVIILEKEKNVGRKLLVAGKGGFNLTNNKSKKELTSYYYPSGFLNNAINSFDAYNLRQTLKDIGIETYVGSSGRIFPVKDIKPAEVLKAITNRLYHNNVKIKTDVEVFRLTPETIQYRDKTHAEKVLSFDYCILATGGCSWSKTGSDGKWVSWLKDTGVELSPFEASNSGLVTNWDSNILNHHLGKPLKNICVKINNHSQKGEAVITPYGLEGNAIYPISRWIRIHLKTSSQPAVLSIDFKPNNSYEELLEKITGVTTKEYAKKLRLSSQAMALLKANTTKTEFLSPELFCHKVKNLPIKIKGLRPIDEVISTVGGVKVNNLNSDYSLKLYKNIFTIGEMVDWDAPTGGFLLQGCFSMAYYVAQKLNNRC